MRYPNGIVGVNIANTIDIDELGLFLKWTYKNNREKIAATTCR